MVVCAAPVHSELSQLRSKVVLKAQHYNGTRVCLATIRQELIAAGEELDTCSCQLVVVQSHTKRSVQDRFCEDRVCEV